jgi:hypothetical protein
MRPEFELPSGEPDRILAAAIYLMSCHARTRCPRIACMVERHLALLGKHPEVGDHVRQTCRQLAAAWRAVGAHDERCLQERASPAPLPPGPLH